MEADFSPYTGRMIREKRLSLGMTRELLAERLGVDTITVWRWERQAFVKPILYYALIGVAATVVRR